MILLKKEMLSEGGGGTKSENIKQNEKMNKKLISRSQSQEIKKKRPNMAIFSS